MEFLIIKRGNELFVVPGPLVPAGTKGVTSRRKKVCCRAENYFLNKVIY